MSQPHAGAPEARQQKPPLPAPRTSAALRRTRPSTLQRATTTVREQRKPAHYIHTLEHALEH